MDEKQEEIHAILAVEHGWIESEVYVAPTGGGVDVVCRRFTVLFTCPPLLISDRLDRSVTLPVL
ncbi:hypothetical protein PHLCEN_2v10992 [Hermanssonia centrifuga]|uniref:Uncharacterized protein n=1 Tax=Hermanssonia centrifuga TaxID=98765 RepID=A0A2R6NLD2_9APHY|nr:hypothetical protein PHLCEN_2v10992 [Hermanssonia centrifuga]